MYTIAVPVTIDDICARVCSSLLEHDKEPFAKYLMPELERLKKERGWSDEHLATIDFMSNPILTHVMLRNYTLSGEYDGIGRGQRNTKGRDPSKNSQQFTCALCLEGMCATWYCRCISVIGQKSVEKG